MMHIQTEVYSEAIVLQLKGRFDYHTMEGFQTALSQAEKPPNPPHIILDLHHPTFIDSMAIGRLVGTWHRLKRESTRFTLAAQTGYVDRVLKEIKLAAIIPTVPTVEEALALPQMLERNSDV